MVGQDMEIVYNVELVLTVLVDTVCFVMHVLLVHIPVKMERLSAQRVLLGWKVRVSLQHARTAVLVITVLVVKVELADHVLQGNCQQVLGIHGAIHVRQDNLVRLVLQHVLIVLLGCRARIMLRTVLHVLLENTV